jgi:hypothetical protein
LKNVKAVIPVLAASKFTPQMMKLCIEAVGVLKPNGSRLSFLHPPPLPAAATPLQKLLRLLGARTYGTQSGGENRSRDGVILVASKRIPF